MYLIEIKYKAGHKRKQQKEIHVHSSFNKLLSQRQTSFPLTGCLRLCHSVNEITTVNFLLRSDRLQRPQQTTG